MKQALLKKLIEIHERLSLEYEELNSGVDEGFLPFDYSEKMDFLEGEMEVLAEIEYFVKYFEEE